MRKLEWVWSTSLTRKFVRLEGEWEGLQVSLLGNEGGFTFFLRNPPQALFGEQMKINEVKSIAKDIAKIYDKHTVYPYWLSYAFWFVVIFFVTLNKKPEGKNGKVKKRQAN